MSDTTTLPRREEEAEGDRNDGARSSVDPPGPDGLPFIGNTIDYLRSGLAFSERLHDYGDVVAYSALGEEFIVIYDPGLVESILVSHSDDFWKGEFEMAFGELFAPDGLAFTEGEQWHRQRRALQPVFTPKRIQRYADAIVERTVAAADSWRAESVIDLREACSKLTLSILADTFFDIDLDGDRGATVRNAVTAISKRMDATGVSNILPEWVPRTPTERRFDRAMDELDALIADLIAERRNSGEHDDLLAALLSADLGDNSIGQTVRDQLVTFIFAGHETTALALTYTIWLLSGRSDIRERLDAELDAVCDTPTAADLPKLDLTERIIKEALRLYPPVYILHRQPRRELTLGSHRIPANVTLQLPTYDIQCDPRWWDEPNSFAPDRWTSAPRPEYAYFPFGGGPRHCIGLRFAMTELKLALATLTQCVEFERVTETIDPSPKVLLDPGRVSMRIHPR